MNPQNKRHPHAELIKDWADGATIQVKKGNGEWEDCNFPVWNEKIEYRIKPSNEPWSPKTDEKYFYLDVFNGEFCAVDNTWNSTDTDYALRRNNNIFPTKKEAEAAIPRMERALKNLYAISDKKAHDLECELYDKIDHLTKYPEIDGKPLTDGEKALIKALRRSDRITNVYDYRTTVLVSANDNASGVYTHRQHIAFFTSSSDADDELIIRALKQIQAEQEASGD